MVLAVNKYLLANNEKTINLNFKLKKVLINKLR